MSIPTQCLSRRIQGCAHRYYRYAPRTAGTYTPYTTSTKTSYQTVSYPIYKSCLTYKPNPISTPSPTNTATKPAVMGNSTAIQEDPTTSASPAVACLAVLIILLLLVPILFPKQRRDTLSARLKLLSQRIRNSSTATPPSYLETNRTSRLEEKLVVAQRAVAMLEQEIADQREECTALQTEISELKEDISIHTSLNITLWNGKRDLEKKYEDLLTRDDKLTAHNHALNMQNHNLSVLNADLMQFIRNQEERNEHLERENVNWKNTLHALHAPPRPVIHPHPTPEPVSPPTPALTRITLQDCLKDLAVALKRKHDQVGFLEEEVRDFEKEVEWRDEMIGVVEEELTEVKKMLEWYKGCVDEMGRWAMWEGEGRQEDAVVVGGEESESEEGYDSWEESESEFGEVVLRDFDGVEEGEDSGWEYIEAL